MSVPPRPELFAPNRAPAWVELKLSAYKTPSGGVWWESRPVIRPRLQLVHTNGASREGSIESAINWGNANPASNTHPHYQVDRHRAAKLVPTDRKGIGNYSVSDWSLVIETADEGYPTPGESSGFIGAQVEMIAQILAYESILHGIPLTSPATWDSAGTAAHTDPFGYPHWTNAPGKVCPGRTKKQQMRDVVLPRAREIAAAWSAPEEPMARYIVRNQDADPAPDFPSSCFQVIGERVAVWVDPGTFAARAVDLATIEVVEPAEFDKYVILSGLPGVSSK